MQMVGLPVLFVNQTERTKQDTRINGNMTISVESKMRLLNLSNENKAPY